MIIYFRTQRHDSKVAGDIINQGGLGQQVEWRMNLANVPDRQTSRRPMLMTWQIFRLFPYHREDLVRRAELDKRSWSQWWIGLPREKESEAAIELDFSTNELLWAWSIYRSSGETYLRVVLSRASFYCTVITARLSSCCRDRSFLSGTLRQPIRLRDRRSSVSFFRWALRQYVRQWVWSIVG